ncbi:aggregation-promoting factor C-terminal-like domain-containing protein [Streptomyces smyrnaeus]|uniref:aggregation-promoting factor C-terminal-like domain-containing protein n=1 Tax=Streptomyces smyrnaeus TaxID=1387713 RepID=UPI0033FA2E81
MASGVLVGRGYVSIRPEFEGDWSRTINRRAGDAGADAGAVFGQAFGKVLQTIKIPIAAVGATVGGALANSVAAAGAGAGAFAAAVKPQLNKVTEASDLYTKAQEAAAEGGKKAAEAQEAYRQSLAKMPPATRTTAKAFIGLKTDFDKWSDSLSSTTMPIFTQGINTLRGALPKLTPLVKTSASVFRGFLADLGQGAEGKVFSEFAGNMQRLAGASLRSFLNIGKNIATGFVGILNAFAPMSRDLTGGLERLSERFASFGANLGQSAGFQQFIGYVRTNFPTVLSLLGNLAATVGHVVVALAPLGGATLTLVDGFASLVAAIPTPVLSVLATVVATVVVGMRAYLLAVAAVRIATAAWAAVQAVLNGTLALNPIGLIIGALVALGAAIYLAYQRSATFRAIVQAAWRGIQAAALWAWNTVLKPTFNALMVAIRFVGRVAMWLWRSVFLPAFRGIAVVITWWWNTVVKRYFALVRTAFRLVATVARWLWHNVLGPVFRGIGKVISWWWNNIVKRYFNTVKAAIRTLASVFRWLWKNVIKPVWNGIRTAIRVAWEKGIRPAFNAVKSAVRAVATAFEKAKDALGKSWAKIKSLTRKPIKWVIDIVYNKGVRGLWNTAAKVLPIKKLPVFKFATGGPVYGPGTATSDSIPARLSRGEHVWTAREVQGAGGHGAVENLRAQARGGYAKGGPVVAKGGVPGFALGGAVDWFKDAGSTLAGGARSVVGSVSKGLSKLKDAALGGVYKAASAAAKPIRSLINKVPGGTKGWGSLAKALPTGILNEALSAIKGSETSTMGGEGVARALKWARSQAGKPYQWGGAGNPSWDCSGFMSGISKVIQGKNPKGRLWSTHAFSGRRAPAGWEYHKKSPFMIGITNAGKGHTAGTLAGVNVESRGGDGVVVGSRARGYRARMFGSRWYGFKPAIGGGGGGGAKATARQMLGEFGFSQKQWPALEKLWQRESGWRWNARNPSSGAYGIPQCVDLNTQILTRRGWLTHNQVRVGDETIGYNQSTGRSEWTRVTDVHHGVGELRRFGTSLWSAVSTPNHRWLVERTVPLCDLPPEPGSIPYGQCQCGCGGTTSLARNPVPEKGIKRGEPNLYLHGHHARGKRRNPDSTHEYFVEQQALQRRQQIVLARPASTASTLDITVQEAALLAWIAGDGWQQKPRPVRGKNVEKGYKSGSTPMTYLIGQTKEENWEAIDAAVGDHGRVTRTRERHVKGQLRRDREWRLSAPYARDLTERAGNPKTDCVQQVLGMSTAQREAWLEAIIAAEGHVSPPRGNTKPVTQITQKAGPLAEAIVLAVYLSGRRPSVYVSKRTGGRHGTVPVWTITLTSPRTGEPRASVNGKECWKDESIGVQDVWCVTTDLGSWTARQGDDVFLTGNSLPASKMRSAGADWRTNPATQIKWGLRYIKSRYGSPSRAWAAWNRRSPHWYDAGGWLQPGATMAMNGTGQPEAILTAQQWRTMQAAVAVGGNSSGPAEFTGDLYLDSGEFMGKVRGVVRRENGELMTALGARAGR